MAEARVTREIHEGEVRWRKRFGPTERAFARSLLRRFALRQGLPALVAPAAQAAAQACATEAAMIRKLHALGMRVPAILERGDTELLLSDLGPTLAATCRATSDDGTREYLLKQGFAALSELHRRGGYASQAFARNLTWRDGEIGFIDLEEDPLLVMPLASAQARDLLLYVQSTARFLAHDSRRYAVLLREALVAEPDEARREAARTARALGWLAALSRPFGPRARAVSAGLEQLAACAD